MDRSWTFEGISPAGLEAWYMGRKGVGGGIQDPVKCKRLPAKQGRPAKREKKQRTKKKPPGVSTAKTKISERTPGHIVSLSKKLSTAV